MKAQLQLESLEERNLCSASIINHGGPVISHVQIEMIFYGSYWNTAPGKAQAGQLQNATEVLIGGKYMDGLAQLGVGRGTVDQVDFVPASVSGKVTHAKVEQIIDQEINLHHLPQPNAERLYLLIGPNGVELGGGEEHGQLSATGAYYAQVPFNYGDSNTAFESETWGITHEVVEAATDPKGNAYFFRNGDEICDRAERIQWGGHYDQYKVSPYWLALDQ